MVEVIRLHADGLLRLARRHSLGAEDAQDAYQRGLEIFLRHAHRLDPEGAPSWLRTVVKHEAMAVRRVRQRELAPADLDFDRLEARTTPSPDEQVVAFEAVARSAEALQRLKPQEVRALWLQAQGNSYEEIHAADRVDAHERVAVLFARAPPTTNMSARSGLSSVNSATHSAHWDSAGRRSLPPDSPSTTAHVWWCGLPRSGAGWASRRGHHEHAVRRRSHRPPSTRPTESSSVAR